MFKFTTVIEDQKDSRGNPTEIQIVPFTKANHEQPGIYLQQVVGHVYEVWKFTPEQALSVATQLFHAVAETKSNFK
jgi:hypothetical protein